MKPVRVFSSLEQAKWGARLFALLALVALTMAVAEWFSPSLPPFRGRFGWGAELLFKIAGPSGFIVFWLGVAVACVVFARFLWRHAPRTPSDRWFV